MTMYNDLPNVYISEKWLRIRRMSYAWRLDNPKLALSRLKINVLDKSITYTEYQEAIIILKGGNY